MEMTKKISIICKYLSLVKKSENNFKANRKSSSCYNIQILYKLWRKFMLFSLHFAKNGTFCLQPTIKGKTTPIKTYKKY